MEGAPPPPGAAAAPGAPSPACRPAPSGRGCASPNRERRWPIATASPISPTATSSNSCFTSGKRRRAICATTARRLDPTWREALEQASRASATAYRALFAQPGFFEFYEQLTPIREIGVLQIASRPVYRSGRVREITDLRAIPWVMSWSQIRLPLPAFYGVAEGLATIPLALRRQLFRSWPFFASTLDSAATALGKGDPEVTRGYLRLCAPQLGERFFPMLADAYARARATLEETFESPLLARHPVLARQIELRDPYIDPISQLQIELLARYRAASADAPERPRLERALMMSIIGIAAGLRNAG